MKKLLSLIFAVALALPMLADDIEAISVAEAIQRIDNNQLDACYVRGIVKSISTSGVENYHNIGYWMTDTEDSKKEIQAFRFKAKDNADYNSAADVEFKVGDEIIVYANKLELYNNKYEMNTGYFVSIASAVVYEEYTVSQTLQNMKDGKDGACYVTGKVTKIMTNNVEAYGNISYWLKDIENPNDSVQAYRMTGLNDVKYKNAGEVEFVVGDIVKVYAKGLKYYGEGDKQILELNEGNLVEIVQGVEQVKLEWNEGTAYRSEGKWRLEVVDGADDSNFYNFIFSWNSANSIKGYHYLAEGSNISVKGSDQAIEEGWVQLKWAGDDNGFNIYDVQAVAMAGGKAYRVNAKIVFIPDCEEGAECGDIELTDDVPFKPEKDGEIITCAQAQDYALNGWLEQGATSTIQVSVVGFVTVTNVNDDATSFWMADEKGTKKIFEAYKSVLAAGLTIAKDMKVKVTGYIQNYKGTTAEIVGGEVVEYDETPVENVELNASAVKFIENGQIYILRNGIRYNVQGQMAE